MREFLMHDELDEFSDRYFFVFAITELIIDGRRWNNCAICFAALNCLLIGLGDADEKWRDEFAEQVIAIVEGQGDVKAGLIAWINTNFPL
jgi:hypothetical protein